jgi:hypothetical protein
MGSPGKWSKTWDGKYVFTVLEGTPYSDPITVEATIKDGKLYTNTIVIVIYTKEKAAVSVPTSPPIMNEKIVGKWQGTTGNFILAVNNDGSVVMVDTTSNTPIVRSTLSKTSENIFLVNKGPSVYPQEQIRYDPSTDTIKYEFIYDQTRSPGAQNEYWNFVRTS